MKLSGTFTLFASVLTLTALCSSAAAELPSHWRFTLQPELTSGQSLAGTQPQSSDLTIQLSNPSSGGSPGHSSSDLASTYSPNAAPGDTTGTRTFRGGATDAEYEAAVARNRETSPQSRPDQPACQKLLKGEIGLDYINPFTGARHTPRNVNEAIGYFDQLYQAVAGNTPILYSLKGGAYPGHPPNETELITLGMRHATTSDWSLCGKSIEEIMALRT